MPQKFLHLNCFFTCGITASNLATFWSIWFAVGGCTRAPKISASFVRTRRSSNAFASVQLFDLTIAVYGPVSDATDETPYQKLACRRICCRGPAVSQVDPSTMPRATSSDALTSVGSIFRDCLYAQTDESFWAFKS